MSSPSRRYGDGLPVALAIHLGIYCAVAVCVAFAVYEFMQPARIPNPGLAAYKAPPGTVVTYIPSFSPRVDFTAANTSAAATPETDGMGGPVAAQPKPVDNEIKREKPKRPQPVYRSERREPMHDYAAQRSFADRTRPWY